jgi:outer membrane protein OmpA-like peptidoglycan-associated protein
MCATATWTASYRLLPQAADFIEDQRRKDQRAAIDGLNPVIVYLQANPTTAVRIVGYTDDSGDARQNMAMSLARAQSVGRALVVSTRTANTIETFGVGQSEPMASNATAVGRAQNRRVEIILRQPGP